MNHISSPAGPVQIRPAIPPDARLLRALRLEALAGHPEVFSADYAATEAQPVESWVERLSDPEEKRERIYVAAAGGQLAGMAGLFWGRGSKVRHSVTVWGVYVRPPWRGRRLAEQLIEACLSWAREHEFTVAKIGVVTTNVPAIRCYSRCGFRVYGIEPKVICWEGVYYDELLMAKELC